MNIDKSKETTNNKDNYLVIEGEGTQLKINIKNLKWQNTGDHQHHYLPDFSDEWEQAVALKCVIPGCIHGVMQKKEGKFFLDWLDKHRAKSRGN